MRLQYPPDIKLILMPCTGRVDIIHLLKAFEGGADAVMVVGCLEGECHYLMGNIRARKRVNKVKKDFDPMGMEPERVEMFNLSSSEGPKFAAIRQGNGGADPETGPQPHETRGTSGLVGRPTQSRRRVKIGKSWGRGQKADALSPTKNSPKPPSPNPIRKGDPPGRPYTSGGHCPSWTHVGCEGRAIGPPSVIWVGNKKRADTWVRPYGSLVRGKARRYLY